eukprot:Mycagemm_TRINITY_DN8424_c0_g1::TRINITY_DN8424_c0_g1_i1::g.4635::m.4635 type:complete len:163 gc:universal TRINITY_DN8424_c0_g1_i1:622-134(-)
MMARSASASFILLFTARGLSSTTSSCSSSFSSSSSSSTTTTTGSAFLACFLLGVGCACAALVDVAALAPFFAGVTTFFSSFLPFLAPCSANRSAACLASLSCASRSCLASASSAPSSSTSLLVSTSPGAGGSVRFRRATSARNCSARSGTYPPASSSTKGER